MDFEKIKKCLFDAANEAGIEEYEIFYTADSSISAETLKDEVSAFSCGVCAGISFRCIVDGRIGMASSELFTEDEMKNLVFRAISNAKNIESDDPAIIFKGSEKYERTSMPEFTMPDAAKIKNNALELQKMTYAESEYVTEGTQSCVFAGSSTMRLMNSHGLELSNDYGIHGAYVQAVVNRDGEAEDEFELKGEIELEALSELPKKAVNNALSKLGASKIPSGKYDVIFSAKQTRSLLAVFSSAFSARSAQLGLSLLAGKEGQRIAADCITIVDDPMREGCMVQTSFDGEGVATYKKTVVEKGILNTLLYDMTTAKKAGVESTANGQRSNYSEAVSIAPYSFYILGGEKTLEQMCMGVSDGVYITAMKGLHAGADAVTGDFSIDSEGFRIRDGKICEAVKSFTVAGNFFEMMKNIEAVSSELSFGLPSGFTVLGAPDILVRKMSVAGE
ncbi:MAG: TldD/PmbA family protein [Ruminococcaceae bacterium]|nr:TldD/PmbA family protein [Oscillospiraceae bacterium]